MQTVIGACGLICSKCDAFTATMAEDQEKLEAVAAHWRKIYQNPDIDAASVRCHGCMSDSPVKCCKCRSGCEIHTCAQKKQVSVCGLCEEFPCPLIHEFLAYLGPQAEAQIALHEAICQVEKQMFNVTKG